MLQIDLVTLMIGVTSSICVEDQEDKTHCSYYFYELSVSLLHLQSDHATYITKYLTYMFQVTLECSR